MGKRYFKVIMITLAVLFIAHSANAQSWQGILSYNGYHVHSLGSLVNLNILVMKDSFHSENPKLIHVKFRIPYRYSGETAVTTCEGATVYLHYKNGWVYFDYFCTDKCPNFIFTVYGSNNPDDSSKGTTTVNTQLGRLNISNLSSNTKEYVTYW